MPNNQWGDFQTPGELAGTIVRLFADRKWDRVLEPTCGSGVFMRAALVLKPSDILGLEINPDYAALAETAGRVVVGDIFAMNLGKLSWQSGGPMLVIGNPPWVTNSAQAVFRSINLPPKSNLKKLKGLDARTGAANFDIAEFIILKLIIELRDEQPTIALLCKTQVARNVLAHCAQFDLPFAEASVRIVDARRWFGAAVEACLFTVSLTGAQYSCDVYPTVDAAEPDQRWGVVDGRIVADADAYEACRQIDGLSPVAWRQGVKHDAAAVMELMLADGGSATRDGRAVDVEAEYLYPLLKSTDVFKGAAAVDRVMVVPQRTLGEDTRHLREEAPALWRYLSGSEAVFESRKSSIYRGRPPFCVFGIGDYTFAPFKVAISGLHKEARFRLVGPNEGRPVVFDDTCYFLPFDTAVEAAVAWALLKSPIVTEFLASIVFWDAKRPITKKVLQRVDLARVWAALDAESLLREVNAGLRGFGVPDVTRDSAAHIVAVWGNPAKQEVLAF